MKTTEKIYNWTTKKTYTKDTVILWLLIGIIIGMLAGYFFLYHIPNMENI